MIQFSFSFVKRIPWVKILILFMCAGGIGAFFILQNNASEEDWVLGAVDIGEVTQIVSVSGTMDSTQIADLSFPITGIVESLSVQEGDEVDENRELARLSHAALKAEYQNAYAALTVVEADRDELVTGLRPEALVITETNVLSARQNLERVKKEQAKRVQNAYRTLLSTDLQAIPENKDGDYTAPEITGTFTCEDGGSYLLDVYRSSTKSGYSFRLSGLESENYPAHTEAPGPIGTCGLSVQFTEGDQYGNSEWTIEIPNTESSMYATNLNAYNLAIIQEQNAIEAAEDALRSAEQNLTLETAKPRTEALARANAKVLQARARLDQIQAQIDNHILKAPFHGVVSSIDLVAGETVGLTPVMTLVADKTYELTALIPEIDITHISVGQESEIIFDARENEVFIGTLAYVSPLAREIGGVSYFEAKLILDTDASWLRSGLNADINIILEERTDALRIPRRFLTEEDGVYSVLLLQDEQPISTPVDVDFIGNDGFAAISGLNYGDTVVAP